MKMRDMKKFVEVAHNKKVPKDWFESFTPHVRPIKKLIKKKIKRSK